MARGPRGEAPRRAGLILKDRYVLGDVLGHGSLGTTYRAYDRLLQRSVAIKLLSERFAGDTKFGQTLMAAAATSGHVGHPHIVTILDAGIVDGRPFLALELVEGQSLRSLLAARGALSVRDALTIGLQVADALVSAHRQGLVHGDLRPENVLIDKNGIARVSDFGLVRAAVATDRTLLGGPGQRASYIPPDQLAHDPMDQLSDVYALAVLVYELLTGAPPLAGVAALRAATSLRPVTPARQIRPDVPERVDRVLVRSLSPVASERLTSAGELRAALSGRENDVPTAAPTGAPPTVWRAETRVQSHRGSHGLGHSVTLLVPLVASLAILVAAAAILIVVFPRLFGGYQLTDAPTLVNYDLGEATSIAAAHGLEVRVVGSQVTDDQPKGTVLSQTPTPNSRLRRGSDLKLTLSAGMHPPNVLGKPIDEARAMIVRAGWNVAEVQTLPDAGGAAGTVVGSRPGPDEAAADRSQGVTLLVAAGNLAHRRPTRLATGGAAPSEIVDGDANTVGKLSGPLPTWVEVDLARPSVVSAVELVTAQEQSGVIAHEVWVWTTANELRGMHTFLGPTEDNQTLSIRFDPPVREVRTVRIATTQSASSVGWREIRVLER